MPQIAVINSSTKLDDSDVAFMVAACDAQVAECAVAWGIPATPVVFYASAAGLPASNCRIMDIVDTIDAPGALGYHDDAAGVIYGRVLAHGADTAITLSHECLEELVDPTSDRYVAIGDGREIALEVGDPVEGDSYAMPATLFKGTSSEETRDVFLSNYVFPEYFGLAGTNGRFDRMGKLTAPFTMTPGGYSIIRDAAGNVGDVFARARRAPRLAAGHLAGAVIQRKLAVPGSRLLRRLSAVAA